MASITRSEEHTSELQSHHDLVCRLLLEKKNTHYLLLHILHSCPSRPPRHSFPTRRSSDLAAGVRFDALQDARVKGMEKIAVAQEKANHFRAALENPPGLRVGAESQAPDGLHY